MRGVERLIKSTVHSAAALGDLGLSSIANIVGAIKYAKYMGLKSDDAVLTVATDGAEMYETELSGAEKRLGGADSML